LSAFELLSNGSPLGEVPLPMTVWIMLLGMAMLIVVRRRAAHV
jgi:hypothetical protein